jgi:hypothetical protein
MPTLFAQSVVEYGGAASAGATSAIAVLGDQLNTVYYAVSNSVSDHPVLWGGAVCVAAWLLIRRR